MVWPLSHGWTLIEELASQYSGKVTFGKMNVDENQTVPSSFGIMSIPAIVVFHKGKPVERIVGAYPKTEIEAVFRRYMANNKKWGNVYIAKNAGRQRVARLKLSSA
jgi:thioredoxin-like negative regulator of GroEL